MPEQQQHGRHESGIEDHDSENESSSGRRRVFLQQVTLFGAHVLSDGDDLVGDGNALPRHFRLTGRRRSTTLLQGHGPFPERDAVCDQGVQAITIALLGRAFGRALAKFLQDPRHTSHGLTILGQRWVVSAEDVGDARAGRRRDGGFSVPQQHLHLLGMQHRALTLGKTAHGFIDHNRTRHQQSDGDGKDGAGFQKARHRLAKFWGRFGSRSRTCREWQHLIRLQRRISSLRSSSRTPGVAPVCVRFYSVFFSTLADSVPWASRAEISSPRATWDEFFTSAPEESKTRA